MADFFTKHLPFWLPAKNLKKTKFWSAIHKSILEFFDPYLFSWSCAPPPNWQKHLSSGEAQDLVKGQKIPELIYWSRSKTSFF